MTFLATVCGLGPVAAKPRVHGLLLHNRKLQNTELQLLYERKALPRSRLCRFVSTLLLESNAGIGLISFALYFHQQSLTSLRFQCARRWFDEGQTSHLVNLGKYVSAMLAAGAKVAYEKDKAKGVGWLCLVVVMSSGATVYQLYWDFVKDWGLLQVNSKNPWLRNDLMLKRKTIYYFSMV